MLFFALLNTHATHRAGHSKATLQPRRTRLRAMRDVVSCILGSYEYLHRFSKHFGWKGIRMSLVSR